MNDDKGLTNLEISKEFKKYLNMRYKPLGMYFSDTLPEGKKRTQGKIFGRCMVGHVFKAAKSGGSSIIQKGKGCPGGLFWAGFRKKIIRGWVYFISHGHDDILGGRAEHFKKNGNVAVQSIKDPGPINLPENVKYIIYRRLKQIPDSQDIKFVLFFVKPNNLAKLISLINYARHAPNIITASAGSGCMSILNYPLEMKKYPNPDGIMGVWDLYARKTIPKNVLTLALRLWMVKEMAVNMSESFLAHTPPFTVKGEIIRFFKKKILKK
ncbi:MAG: hypothetical protein GF329_14505 [Candidatus Lokiarchaeota archaeon]|nr:hypothetical protein [Candidatus Lokiarchaeota archaeon]